MRDFLPDEKIEYCSECKQTTTFKLDPSFEYWKCQGPHAKRNWCEQKLYNKHARTQDQWD